MLRLRNPSRFVADATIIPDAGGVDHVVVALVDSVDFAGAAVPATVDPIDRYGEDAELLAPGDLCLPPPATSVLVFGCVYAPGGRARQCEAAFTVGPVTRRLLVCGDRSWRRRRLRLRPGDPAEFSRMPLDWRCAFGGAGAGGAPCDERNPIGVGLRAEDGAPLPNLELAESPLRSSEDRPVPAATGAVAPHWQPRRALGGTYDERWRRERAPYLPRDFDARFLDCAPRDQVTAEDLRGAEVLLTRLTPAGREAFALPARRPVVDIHLGRERHAVVPRLAIVAIHAETRSVRLLWRASWRCDERALSIDEITVGEES
jgi:hypothetical protein